MKKALAILLLLALTFAEFKLERAETIVSNIQKDGSAKVTEHIKFFVIGAYEQEKYKAGISNNDLANWASLTGVNEVKIHINGANVDIRDFSLRPQPLSKCDPFLDLCHGELILSYEAYPYFNKNTKEQIKNTGIFNVDQYKPRTVKYTLNPQSLSFRTPSLIQKNDSAVTTTSENVIILDKNVYFTIMLPQNNVVLDISQSPEEITIDPPVASVQKLIWTNTILGQFVVVFEVEQSLDKEVVEFFSNIPKTVQQILFGNQGLAIIIILVIIIGSVIYLKSLEKKN